MKKKILSMVLSFVMGFSINAVAFAAAPEKVSNPSQKNGVNFSESTTSCQNVELAEGQTIIISLISIQSTTQSSMLSAFTISPKTITLGNAGYISVSRSGNRIYYNVVMSKPATTFTGYISIMDLTSKLSSGMSLISGFSGSVAYSNLSLHKYSATLDGTAYLLGVPISTTSANYYYWTA